MNYFRRALLVLKRTPIKNILIILLVTTMSSFISFSFLTNQTIINTDLALRRMLPPVVSIHFDSSSFLQGQQTHFESYDEWINPVNVTTFQLRQIGNLDYVQSFDFNLYLYHAFSDNYYRFFDMNLIQNYFNITHPTSDALSYRTNHNLPFERFGLTGVENENIFLIESGLLELSSGRPFTKEEILNGNTVVIVSDAFLELNNLNVGDYLILDYRIQTPMFGNVDWLEFYSEENTLAIIPIELEIVGSFYKSQDEFENHHEINRYHQLQNTLFVSNYLVERFEEILGFYWSDFLPELEDDDPLRFDSIPFLLFDPLEIDAFHEAALEILPDFWTTANLLNSYENVNDSMSLIKEISDSMFIFSSISLLIALIITFILIIRERRHEFGIYLALGEKIKRIILQLIFEFSILVLIGLIMGFIIGFFISEILIVELFSNDLLHRMSQPVQLSVLGATPEGLGFIHRLSHEEIMEIFNITISGNVILNFLLLTLGIVIISTSISLLSLRKFSVKDILTLTNGS